MARNRVQTWGAALLLLTALIWGMAFVAQSVGMDYLGPCAFNGVRSLIGGVALLPVIALSKHLRKNAPEGEKPAGGKARLLLWGSASVSYTHLVFQRHHQLARKAQRRHWPNQRVHRL